MGSLRLSPRERTILNDVYLRWAVRVGKSSEYLLNIYYEERFDTNVDELRMELGIEKAPDP